MASKKLTADGQVAFTTKFLNAIVPGPNAQQFTDLTHPGLVIVVQPMGKRKKPQATITFFYRYLSPATGKRTFENLGRYIESRHEGAPPNEGTATLKEAREKRDSLDQLVRGGIDPKLAAKVPDTLETVAKIFIERKEKSLSYQTVKTYKSALNSKVLPKLGHKRIALIRRDEVVSLLDDVYKNSGFEMMRQTKKALSSMYTFARDQHGVYGIETNIIKDISLASWKAEHKKMPKKPKRWLRSDEIKRFWDFLDGNHSEFNDSHVRLWKLILIIGCRPIEAIGMRWSDIGNHNLEDVRDLEKIMEQRHRLWLRPAELMKADVPHLTYLTDLALDVIQPLQGNLGDYVLWLEDPLDEKQLIARRKYSGQVLKMAHGIFNKHELKDKRKIPQLTGIQNFKQHDLRRTVSTQMGNLGIDKGHISQVLSHKVRDKNEATVTREHYNLAEYIHEKIDALTRWEEKLREILKL